MLYTKRVRRLSVPRLKGDALEWVERALAIGMNYDYRTVTRAFIDTFPFFLEETSVSKQTALKILEKRFRRMRRDKRCSSYHRIKEHQKRFLELFEDPLIASHIYWIIELEKMRQISNLTVEQQLKIHDAARKIHRT